MEKIVVPKISLRHFPVKSMFLDVIKRPILYRAFDRQVLLKQVSKEVDVTKLTAHHNFSNYLLINNTIKLGEWNNIVDGLSALSCTDSIYSIVILYGLEDTVAD